LFEKIISNVIFGQIYKEKELFYKRAVVVLMGSQGKSSRRLFGPFSFCSFELGSFP
jgi:hypothetical protein